MFSLQRSFLLLTRLAVPKSVLFTPNTNESQNPRGAPFCKICFAPVADTKGLDPVRTIQTRTETIPLVRNVLRYTKKSWMHFFCCTLQKDSCSRQAEISCQRLRFFLAVPVFPVRSSACMHTVAASSFYAANPPPRG
jgi:hypothetical protein